MGTKGHPGIYLLAAVFAAAFLSGCADTIQENEPHFSIRADLDLGWGASRAEPGAVISSIYRKDEPAKVFTPSASALDIWLKSGTYIAKINRCDQQFNDSVRDVSVRLAPDHLLEFSVQGHKRYHLECTTGPDGTIYALINDLQIEPTD